MKYHKISVVDENDNAVGEAMYEEIIKKGLIMRSANIFVFNSEGKILIHKRSRSIPTYPGMWDVKLGGIVDAGESYEEAATRELKEEAGIENAKLTFLFAMKVRDGPRKINRKTFMTKYDGELKLQKEELEEAKYAEIGEILEMKAKGMLSKPALQNLEMYLKWKSQKK